MDARVKPAHDGSKTEGTMTPDQVKLVQQSFAKVDVAQAWSTAYGILSDYMTSEACPQAAE